METRLLNRRELEVLMDKDDNKAYAEMKRIAEDPEGYYAYLNDFADMLVHKKSYVRTRGFVLCASLAEQDTEDKVKDVLPAMLGLFHDPKPITVRQCLKAVMDNEIFRNKYKKEILKELDRMDLTGYKDSMSPLIRKDMEEVRGMIERE